jgi:SAM-dependent methyltransferase
MQIHSAIDTASPWVVRFTSLIAPGEVLDLACGNGRHSRLLAARGYSVLAVDRDVDALANITEPGITTRQIDLESGKVGSWPFEPHRFAGIVVTNYLHRPLFARMLASLAPNGILIYETFAQGNERFGKPSNPDFLLKPGELLDLVRSSPTLGLQVVAFEDGYCDIPRPAMVQRICAVKAASYEFLHHLGQI